MCVHVSLYTYIYLYSNSNTYESMKTNRHFGYHHCEFMPAFYLGHAMNASFILKFSVFGTRIKMRPK